MLWFGAAHFEGEKCLSTAIAVPFKVSRGRCGALVGGRAAPPHLMELGASTVVLGLSGGSCAAHRLPLGAVRAPDDARRVPGPPMARAQAGCSLRQPWGRCGAERGGGP